LLIAGNGAFLSGFAIARVGGFFAHRLQCQKQGFINVVGRKALAIDWLFCTAQLFMTG